MKKFKFNLEGLLKLRSWEEQRSRQTLSSLSAEIDRLEQSIETLADERRYVVENWASNNMKGFRPVDRMALSSQLESIQTLSAETSGALTRALKQRQDAIERLNRAVRAKKVVENLKVRRLEEYRADIERQEAKEIEDVFNARRREKEVV